MTRLFIFFYLGVLLVLFLAWYVHGVVLGRYGKAEWHRVVKGAHGGGARLAAGEIDSAQSGERQTLLEGLQKRFGYPIEIVPLADLPADQRQQVSDGDEVVFYEQYRVGGIIITPLSNGQEVVRLGPLPGPSAQHIERGLAGGVRLAAAKLNGAQPSDRDAVLAKLRERFDYPVEIVSLDGVPPPQRGRISRGDDVVFYRDRETGQFFVVTPMAAGEEVIRFGPFPHFERRDTVATATTLALVLLPAALAIALLLRPVARQLRRVEDAAKAIAGGDLSARVDERRVRSAKPLAQAFNNMAGRIEALVRTQRELLQAVSHELRTPLSRMRFAIELIETATDDAQRKQRLESLDAATEELDELVGELLSYVRMETSQPQSHREQVVLQDALDVLIPKYAALHPAIRFDVSDGAADPATVVFADRAGLQRVLGNLLSNAGRCAKSRVTISTGSTDGHTTVDVDDDGLGIPDSERERVFEPFVRLDDGSGGSGVGLGLALVKRIVTQHGGGVEVASSPLGGCKIRTTWPNE